MSNLGQAHIQQGNWEEAKTCLSQSQDIFEEIGSDVFIPELERRWGELLLKTGDPDRALSHVNNSIDLATEQESRLEMGMSMRVLGEVHLVNNNYDAAKIALDKSLAILRELESDYEAAKTVLALVRLAMRSGKRVDQDQLDQAVSTFQELEAQHDLAEAMELQDQLE
jgi:tetratricopeptide (TPR) repeat protein